MGANVFFDKLDATKQKVVQTIANVAKAKGVDVRTAEASAFYESGFSPTSVGDNNTSFGIYNLHQGGELGNLTPQQAFDPYTNANVALSVFASNSGISDPGALAAASQRPADPSGYAAHIDALYNDPTFLPDITPGMTTFPGGTDPATGQPAAYFPGTHIHIPGTGAGGSIIPDNPVTSGAATIGKDIMQGFFDILLSPFGLSTSDLPSIMVRLTLIIFGLILIVVALHGLTSSGDNPVSVTLDGAQKTTANAKKISSSGKQAGEVAE